jgi:hypothetical protein
MRLGNLQAQVPWTNAFWFADREARQRLTKGSLANKGRSVLRLRRTDRTRIIAESQGNAGFPLADSQSAIRSPSPMLPENSRTQLAHWVIPTMQFSGRTQIALPTSAFISTGFKLACSLLSFSRG